MGDNLRVRQRFALASAYFSVAVSMLAIFTGRAVGRDASSQPLAKAVGSFALTGAMNSQRSLNEREACDQNLSQFNRERKRSGIPRSADSAQNDTV
jgi:hypothetical protein